VAENPVLFMPSEAQCSKAMQAKDEFETPSAGRTLLQERKQAIEAGACASPTTGAAAAVCVNDDSTTTKDGQTCSALDDLGHFDGGSMVNLRGLPEFVGKESGQQICAGRQNDWTAHGGAFTAENQCCACGGGTKPTTTPTTTTTTTAAPRKCLQEGTDKPTTLRDGLKVMQPLLDLTSDEDVRNTVINALNNSEKNEAGIDTLQAMSNSELLEVLVTVLQC
jgi:hypothetical protein